MTCPDPVALARATSPDAAPAVAEHLKTCASCWLDWQIQQGTRYALAPDIEVPSTLTHRAVVQIERKARRREEAQRWWDLSILGTLVAIAAFAFLLVGGTAEVEVAPGPAAVAAIMAGIVAALYTRRQDLKEERRERRSAA